MWKERLWQMFLVAILGLVLTMCSRSGGNNNTSSSDTVNAEGTSTVSVSSMPSLKVESLPSMTITMDNSSATPVAVTSFPTITVDNSSTTSVAVTSFPTVTVILANAELNAISHSMLCLSKEMATGSRVVTYNECDATDDTVFGGPSSHSITHDVAYAAGWKQVSGGLFHK